MNRTGVLLINLGSPASPSVRDVTKYLREFLGDPHVIDLPFLTRFFLVSVVIVPSRSRLSARMYRKIWTKAGSPLLVNTAKLREALQQAIDSDFLIKAAMRYQSPSIEDVLKEMKSQGVKKVIAVPLYPQHASSTTTSTVEKVKSVAGKLKMHVQFTEQFYSRPSFINAWVERVRSYRIEQYDHILFSFHGLPERHLRKLHVREGDCLSLHCEELVNDRNHNCYRATCYETARLIAERLGLPREKYTICFQSRLGKEQWLKPYTDSVIKEKATQGLKKMLVFAPSFVADCLETLYEIEIEYNNLFVMRGGERIDLVQSLNDHPAWVDALKEMIEEVKK